MIDKISGDVVFLMPHHETSPHLIGKYRRAHRLSLHEVADILARGCITPNDILLD